MKGITVEEFLQGAYLQRGDIVLCRGKKGLVSRLIRWGTKSYFSHSALIFAVPHHNEGFDKAFVIESIGEGIDLTDLNHYLESDHYDIAIRRLERPWFTEQVPALPKKIRGQMLDFIKGHYDFLMILRIGLSLGYSLLFRREQAPFEATLLRLLEKGKIVPSAFICSGFVQHGYYKAIKREIDSGRLPKEYLQDVIFHTGGVDKSSTARRLATSPRELALSEQLEWRFASRREQGVTTIYPITSRKELEDIFGPL